MLLVLLCRKYVVETAMCNNISLVLWDASTSYHLSFTNQDAVITLGAQSKNEAVSLKSLNSRRDSHVLLLFN